MPSVIDVKVDTSKVRLRLDVMPDRVREALRDITRTLANELLARVQSLTPVKTGLLEASERAVVRVSKTRVSGTVNVSKSAKGQRGIAAILEGGADVPAHEILPDAKSALSFVVNGKQAFAAVVHHPADKVPASRMFEQAFGEMEGEIVSEMEETVKNAASLIV